MEYKTERMIYQIDETRDKILEYAEKRFIEKGLFETTMSSIAKGTGLSRTSLYRYFRDKLELSLTIVVKRLEQIGDDSYIRPQADQLPDGISRVGYLLKERWMNSQYDDSYRFLAEFDAYYSGSRIPEGFRTVMEKAMVPVLDKLLRRYIQEGQADGTIRTDMDVELIQEILGNGIRSFQQRMILRGKILVDIPLENLGIITEKYHRVLLDGIKK